MRTQADCLVIGGGPAGSMAALRLAKAGCRVLLLEKEREAHHKVCGEFLSPEAVAYLQQAGVDPVDLGAAPIHALRFSAGKKTVELELPFRALSLSRRALDEALLMRAAACGSTVRRGILVEKLVRESDGWIASCISGESFTGKDVFLATGKHDLRNCTRGAGVQNDLVGFKMYWRLPQAGLAALRGAMELFLFPGGYGGLSLVEDGAANLCLVVRKTALRKLGGWHEVLAAIKDVNALMRSRLEGAQPLWPRPLAISSIPYGYIANAAGEMWRVGDQAAVIPSLTGDGISIALHSAALASEMYLAGSSPAQSQAHLGAQLKTGMRVATLLSRVMVTPLGHGLAPAVVPIFPGALRWIASATRIPEQALLQPSSL